MKKSLLMLICCLAFSGCAKKKQPQNENPQEEVVVQANNDAVDNDIKNFNNIASKNLVYFNFDSTKIVNQNAISNIANAMKQMNNYEKYTFVVNGYCDKSGADDYNDALGERRANAVKKALSQQGVNIANVKIKSFGKRKFKIVSKSMKDNFRKNRKAKVYAIGK